MNNRGNKRRKPVTIVLSEDEWKQLAKYGNYFDLSPTAAGRRLIMEGLNFHQ